MIGQDDYWNQIRHQRSSEESAKVRAERAAKRIARRAAEQTTAMVSDAPANVFTRTETARGWGRYGVRYDERCACCGRTADVDNNTSACRRCY